MILTLLIFQIIEGLSFLHYSGQVIHKNVCPSSILITKRGTWKLAGFEFIGKCLRCGLKLHGNISKLKIFCYATDTSSHVTDTLSAHSCSLFSFYFHLILTEKCHETDAVEPIMCPPWSTRLSKMAQPNLDFTAPEIQTCSNCSILSDMFSLGLVICTIFNNGKPLIQAQNSPSAYLKQLEMVKILNVISVTFLCPWNPRRI